MLFVNRHVKLSMGAESIDRVLQHSIVRCEQHTQSANNRSVVNALGLNRRRQCVAKADLAWLAWPGLAWNGLAWPGLAWPGLAWPNLSMSGQALPVLACLA